MNREQRVKGGLAAANNLKPFAVSEKKVVFGERAPRKVLASIEDAVRACGLKDGMTVSFHHGFRGGDYTVNMVMDVLAKMGFKNLTVASSSLTGVHAPLVEHIKNGVVSKLYSSGLRGKLADAISAGILKEPVQIHSHGGRVHLVKTGELKIDVAFLGVPVCDPFGNANGQHGQSICGSLGYAMTDAQYADKVVLLTEAIETFPTAPHSIAQDEVDYIVQVDAVGDPAKIGADATRMTTNPRELLIARRCAEVIAKSGYFYDGFSLQTGTGGASLAVTRFLEDKMRRDNITAAFGLGGITATMVALHEKGLIKKLLDGSTF